MANAEGDRGSMSDHFVIEGGHAIGGSVAPSGNKNEALPLLAASLLAAGPVSLENVPRIRDVEFMIEIIRRLGVSVEWADHAVEIDALSLRDFRADVPLASEMRGSFLLAAPLLARLGQAVLPQPGGDRIGRRRLRHPPPRPQPTGRPRRPARGWLPFGAGRPVPRGRGLPGRGERDGHRDRDHGGRHRRGDESGP